MSRTGTVPIIVLFYHRVADEHPNDWTISRADFTQQIDWFQQQFDIVGLEEVQNRIRSGYNDRPTLSITFDDGYAENSDYALPLLIERKIPATYFATVNQTLKQTPFPHDIERGRPLPTNSLESLIAMDAAGIEIGAHTRSHTDLGKVTDDQVLIDEVITSSLELEAAIGRKIRYFAFPYGLTPNLNSKVFGMLRSAGFLGACSAYGGWNDVGDDPFHIQRLHGDPNIERIKNWLTYDPRISAIEKYSPSSETFDRGLFDAAIQSARSGNNIQSTTLSIPNSPSVITPSAAS